MASHKPDLAIAIPTFIGSLLSFVATSVAIALHIFSPPKRHFRHGLIVNLLVADFVNSLNNTISGAITLVNGHDDSPDATDSACLANAWIGQLSVQAVDFNILIISIVVLYAVRNSRLVAESSMKTIVALCVAAWIPGLITSNIGLGLGVYGNVSGNWCWIRPQFLGLRYVLTHGWRIAIFIITIAIYTYIYIRLKRIFGRFRVNDSSTGNSTIRDGTVVDDGATLSDTQHILVSNSFAVSHELHEHRKTRFGGSLNSSPGDKATFWSVSAEDGGSQSDTKRHASTFPPRPQSNLDLLDRRQGSQHHTA